MILQLSFHRSHGQVLKTASKQWCNFAPLRKVSASETFSYGTAGFADHSHTVVQGAAESLKCCTCSLEGAVCIPLHASSGFNSQVVCCSVCAVVQRSKRRQVLVEIQTHTHSHTAQYTCSHLYFTTLRVQLLKLIEQGLHASRSAFEHYCGCNVYTEGFHS